MDDLAKIESELDAAFLIEVSRSAALRALVALYGRTAVYCTWKLGWIVGKQAGLAQAQEVFSK